MEEEEEDFRRPSCNVCALPANWKCGRCHKKFYCERKCQKIHWLTHKRKCRPIAASLPTGLATYGQDIQVMIITWNMAGKMFKLSEWERSLNDDTGPWSGIVGKKNGVIYDIYAVGLQECPSADKFIRAFSAKLAKIGSLRPFILNVIETAPTVGKYNHKLAVWVKGNLVTGSDNTIFTNKKICLGKLCTKSSLISRVKLSNGAPDVVLISSHFPVSPKSPDLGNAARQKAYDKTYEYLRGIAPLTDRNPRATSYFWFGDLNYRVVNGKDQLAEVLKSRKSFDSFQEEAIHFKPTCKFAIARKGKTSSDYGSCRSGKSTEKSSCYDPKRTPSFCDRILYSTGYKELQNRTTSLQQIIPIEYASFFPEQFAQQSDHNPVKGIYQVKY